MTTTRSEPGVIRTRELMREPEASSVRATARKSAQLNCQRDIELTAAPSFDIADLWQQCHDQPLSVSNGWSI